MAMHNNGLSKLTEECGEVLQVIGKLNAFPSGIHPDGKKDLYLRMEDELADLLAAADFVVAKLELNRTVISKRRAEKLAKFNTWELTHEA